MLNVAFECALLAPSKPRLPQSLLVLGHWQPVGVFRRRVSAPTVHAPGEPTPSLCATVRPVQRPPGSQQRAGWLEPGIHSARKWLMWQGLEGSRLISRHLPLPGAPHPACEGNTAPSLHASLRALAVAAPTSWVMQSMRLLFSHNFPKTKDPGRGAVFICFAFLLRL